MSPESNLQEQDHQVAPKNEPGGWEELILAAGLSVRATNVLLKNFSSCDEFLSFNVISFAISEIVAGKPSRNLLNFGMV